MREIVYRGKRIDNGEWVEGAYFPQNDTYPTTIFERHCAGYFVRSETVGQYTGLKDMDGKRIFEGDIVEGVCYNKNDGYGVVKWDDGAFIVSNNDWCGTFVENYDGEMFKIIGNIHDNPELIMEMPEPPKEEK